MLVSLVELGIRDDALLLEEGFALNGDHPRRNRSKKVKKAGFGEWVSHQKIWDRAGKTHIAIIESKSRFVSEHFL